MKKYKNPITYEDLENQDLKLEKEFSIKYADEISHFKRTAELFISLFSNSKRTSRQEGKTDYMQLIAVRILHDCRSALILGLRGLYPQSLGLTRGVLESIFLLYDFYQNPENEDIWFNAGKNKRETLFKAAAVRDRVKEFKPNIIENGKPLYDLLSDWSVHSNQESYIWYIEILENRLLYHWAGHGEGKRTDMTILSVVGALAQGLLTLIDEGMYAVNGEWLEDYLVWKKEYLEFAKKMGKIFGDEEIQKMEMKEPIFIKEN